MRRKHKSSLHSSHGIPKGLPWLTGFVIYCEIVEEAMADSVNRPGF